MLSSPESGENAGATPSPTGPMTTAALETAADHVAERAADATGLRPRFEIVAVDGDLRLLYYDEPLVTLTPGVQVPADFDPAEVGEWFARELFDVRGWTAADLVSVRIEVLERQLDRIEERVTKRVATLLRRKFVDPRTCFHGPHGGVVGSLTYDIVSAPPADDTEGADSAWASVNPTVPNDPQGLPSPKELDGQWPPTGLHVWNDTTVEAFFPVGDDPLEPVDVEVLELVRQITVPVGTDGERSADRAERELEAHGEAYLRPADDVAAEWDETAFREAVEAVSAAVEAPHRLEIEGFRARLVEDADDE